MREPGAGDPRLAMRGNLAALAVAQDAWREDLAATVHADGEPADALLRWNETLSQIRLALARIDRRLAGLPVPPGIAEAPAAEPHPRDGHRLRVLLEQWFDRHGISTAWRRVDDPDDLDQEAEHADITTDLAEVLAVAARTGPALHQLLARETPFGWEAEAYYAVIAPWRLALRHLDDVLAWIRDRLAERPDW